MVRYVCAALAAALLVPGCGSVGTPNVDASYKPGANGVLLASVSASGYIPGTLWFQVVPTGAVTQAVASIPVNDPSYGLDWSGDPAVAKGGVGRLAVVELGPGEYELRRWVINISNREAYTSVKPLGYRFSIESGKASYLGSVHLDIQRGAIDDVVPFAVTLEDERARDLALLHRKYPSLRAAQVVFAGDRRREPAPEQRSAAPLPTRLDDLQNLLPR